MALEKFEAESHARWNKLDAVSYVAMPHFTTSFKAIYNMKARGMTIHASELKLPGFILGLSVSYSVIVTLLVLCQKQIWQDFFVSRHIVALATRPIKESSSRGEHLDHPFDQMK